MNKHVLSRLLGSIIIYSLILTAAFFINGCRTIQDSQYEGTIFTCRNSRAHPIRLFLEKVLLSEALVSHQTALDVFAEGDDIVPALHMIKNNGGDVASNNANQLLKLFIPVEQLEEGSGVIKCSASAEVFPSIPAAIASTWKCLGNETIDLYALSMAPAKSGNQALVILTFGSKVEGGEYAIVLQREAKLWRIDRIIRWLHGEGI
jgi:hypothetical protein